MPESRRLKIVLMKLCPSEYLGNRECVLDTNQIIGLRLLDTDMFVGETVSCKLDN